MGIRIREAVPRELFDWITSLTEAVPSRSVVTFIELLIGGMLSSSGFVGDAFQMLTMRRKWTGYQKWKNTPQTPGQVRKGLFWLLGMLRFSTGGTLNAKNSCRPAG